MKLKTILASAFLLIGGCNLWAQTDVTSTYLTNADFEGDYSSYSKPKSDRDIYQPTGWAITYSSGNENDLTSLNSSCTQWSNFSSRQQPVSGGNNTYWIRYRWGSSVRFSLSQTATLPAGVYRVSADAFAIGNNATATISAAGKSVTIDTRNAWANYGFVFTLTESTSVTFAFNYNQSAQAECIAGVDNFKLVNITQGASDITAQNWTSMISNAGFELGSPASGGGAVHAPYGFTMTTTLEGWQDGNINTTNPSEGSKLYNMWAGTTTSIDMYQQLQLPIGKYTITADLRTESGKISNQGVYAKIGDDTYKSETIQTIGDPWNGAEAWNTLTKDFYVQTAGNVQVGASSTGGANSVGWFQIDNFTLTYKGAIQNTPYSITSGTATAAAADTWYAITITANGDYRIISSVANTVYYTQNGYYVPSDVSTNVALTAGVKQVVALTTGTLYVKASEAATLTIEPDSYSYSVGDGTLSVADNSYTQSNTMTVTFDDAATNDPDGALSILDASKIKVNDVAASASIDGKVLTITLASPLDTSTDYAVSIEAGAVGYNVDNTNAAISLTAKTPAVFDGTYFIATTDGTKFISRGGDSNTEAVLDEFGIAVNLTTDANNVTHIQFVDNDKNLFGGSSSIYTDKNESDLGENAARARWTVATTTDGYSLYSGTWSKYIKAGTGAESGKEAATYDESAYAWTLVTPAAHAALMATYKDVNAAAVATAAGLSASTVAALETALADFASEAVTPTNAYSSVTEKYQPNGYSETIISEQELTGLKNGIYKVTLSAFHRIRDYAGTYTCSQNNTDNPISYLYANGQKVQIPSPLTEGSNDAYSTQDSEQGGKHYPNGMTSAGEAFTAGKYNVVVYAVVTDGTLKIGLKDPGKYSNANWICFRDLAVTSYVFNGDYSDLETAILTAEDNLGFEDGENAPYNNVASMGILNSAKALNTSRDALNQDEINDKTSELTGASWTSNDGAVDIIYNGNFAEANGTNPKGWTRSNGAWGQQITGLTAAENDVDAETTTAWYYNTNGAWEYGKDDVYKMPLAASQAYKLTFKYRSHSSNSNNSMKASVLNDSDEGLAEVTFAKNGDATKFVTATAYFTTGAAGNYVLSLTQNGNTHLTDVSLVKVASATKSISEESTVVASEIQAYYETATLTRTLAADKWNTFSVPFDFTVAGSALEGARVMQFSSIDGNVMTVEDADEIVAGEPYLVKPTSDIVDPTFENVIVSNPDEVVKGTGDYKFKANLYNNTSLATDGTVAYLSATDGSVKRLTSGGIKGLRAIFLVPAAVGVKEFVINFGGTDGVMTLDAEGNLVPENAPIYNLAGQQLRKVQKGVNLVSGKAVLVK